MPIAGIIAEYNPFHRGHQWQLQEVRRRLGENCGIVCAMSGNWVQRGECAAFSKQARAEMALMGGADLVLELPLPWAISSAEGFARGGVEVLAGTGLVDTLAFGSESGDLKAIEETAACLETEEFRARLKKELDRGVSFPAARQIAAEGCMGKECRCLEHPNDLLGVEYVKAIRRCGCGMAALAIPRKGVGHDQEGTAEGFASASFLRRRLMESGWESCRGLMPEASFAIGDRELERGLGGARLEYCQRGVLARMRSMDREALKLLPDCSEGLENRLWRAGQQAVSLDELYEMVKTKRYAHARVRRMVLWAFLGMDRRDVPEHVPYLRVLGANGRGQEILKRMKETATLPVLTKPAHARGDRLTEAGRRLFELEARATDLWRLCLPELAHSAGGGEWLEGPVILDGSEA